MFGKQNGFTNIPLRRRIEALALTAVTVIASMSVDWSSLTARAEDGGEDLTNYVTLDNSNPVIIQQISGSGQGSTNDSATTQPYDAITAAYANFRVTGGSADYTVDVYQNYKDDYFKDNYNSYTSENCVINKGGNSSMASGTVSSMRYANGLAMPLWIYDSTTEVGDSPIILAQGERAAIVITFSNITDGTTIEYGTNGDTTIDTTVTYTSDSFVEKGTSLSGGTTPIVMTSDQTDGVSFAGRFALSPNYDRGVKYALDTNGDQIVTLDESKQILSPKDANTSGSTVLKVSAPGAATLEVPVKVVSKGTVTATKTYDGTAISGVAPVCGTKTDGTTNTLSEGTDYTVTYNGLTKDEAVNAGTYTATVNGLGEYVGLTYSREFTISQKSLGSNDALDSTVYGTPDGTKLTINPAVPEIYSDNGWITDTNRNSQLKKDVDYAVDSVIRDGTDLKKFTVTIHGINNYTGTVKIQVTNSQFTTDKVNLGTMIQKIEITDGTNTSRTFDGNSHPLTVKLFDINGTELTGLKQGTDYTYSVYKTDDPTKEIYSSADANGGVTEAGDYKVIVTGAGDYIGNVDSSQLATPAVFTVNPLTLTAKNFVVTIPSSQKVFYYDGTNADSLHPTTVNAYYPYTKSGNNEKWSMTAGNDFTIDSYDTYQQNKSRYSFTLTGKGNFAGTVYFGDKDKTDLATDSDPFFQILDSLDAATVTLFYDGKTAVAEKPKDGDWTRVADASAFQPVYTGSAIQPDVTVSMGTNTLRKDTDYSVTYDTASCTKAGTAALYIRGMGSYAGQNNQITVTFTIGAKALDTNAVKVNVTDTAKVYAFGSAITLKYSRGNDSEYYVLKDPADETSRMTPATPTDTEIASGADAVAAAYPNADYYITYENNTEASQKTGSKARIIAHGINNYTGTATGEFTIAPLEIKEGSSFVIADLPDMPYTGSNVTIPDDKIIVRYIAFQNPITLVKDTDYTVSYSKNHRNTTEETKETYLQVNGTGNYTGLMKQNFKIVAKSINDGTIQYIIGPNATSSDYKSLGKTNDPDISVEYSGKAETSSTLPVRLRLGDTTTYLVAGTDYDVTYPDKYNVGFHTVTITGKGDYKNSYAKITYYVDQKDINNVTNLNVYPITKAQYDTLTTDAQKASVLATGTDIIRYYQVRNGSSVTDNAIAASEKDEKGTKSYTWTWTKSDGTTTENAAPTKAGDDYTLTLTGAGNYKGTKTFTTDANGGKFMVGASLDVNGIVDLAETEGTEVPFLGSNMPVVAVNPSALTKTASTGAEFGDVNGYNTNVSFEGTSGTTMVGPSYTSGKYVNGETGQDYTIEYVDDSGNVLTSLPVGTSFKVRISAVEGSTRFFGSHTILNARTIKANTLSALAARSKLTVSDPKSTTSYVKDPADSTKDTKLTYSYTGSAITPQLTAKFEPQATEADKKGVFADGTDTFAPITLPTDYVFTYKTNNTDNDQVLAADVTDKGSITLNGDGTNFTAGATSVPYAITAHELTQDDITIDASKLNYTYDGTSHKDDITGAVTVSSMGTKLKEGTDYTLKFYKEEACTNEAQEDDFKNAGTLYVKITAPASGLTGKNFTIPSTGLVAKQHFTIAKRNLSQVSIKPTYGGTVMKSKDGVDYTVEYPADKTISAEVTDGGITINATDYSITAPSSIVLGANTINVEATAGGNYTGSQMVNFYVYADLSDSTQGLTPSGIENNAVYVLNESGVPVKDNSNDELNYKAVTFSDTDNKVTLKYSDNFTAAVKSGNTATTTINTPGKYTITYTGAGVRSGCIGSYTDFIVTVKGDLQYATIVGLKDNYDFAGLDKDGKGINPGPTKSNVQVTLNGVAINSNAYIFTPSDEGHDYKPVTGRQDASVTITADSSATAGEYYTGSKKQWFNIRYNLRTAEVSFKDEGYEPQLGDDISNIEEQVVVKYKNKPLNAGTDFTFSPEPKWTSVANSNTAKLVISLAPDADEDLSYNTKSYTYNGKKKDLKQGAGTVDPTTTTPIPYDGADHFDEFVGSLTVYNKDSEELTKDKDYTITVTKDDASAAVHEIKNAGTYKAIIKGMGDYYTDSDGNALTVTFEIQQASLSNDMLTIDDTNAYYADGAEVKAPYTVTDSNGNTLTKDKDFTEEYKADNWNAQTEVTLTLTGTGNYQGTATKSYTIKQVSLEQSDLVTTESSAEYNGKPQTPMFTIKRTGTGKELVEDTDYTITTKPTVASLTNVSDTGAHYEITGKGNYTGTLSFDFKITPKDISTAAIALTPADGIYAYTGSAITPEYTASIVLVTGEAATTMAKGTDFTEALTNNTASHANDGTDASPTVTLTGTGNYTGTAKAHFQIGTSIADAKVTLTKPASFEYDGEAHTPTIASISAGSTPYTGSDIAKVATITYKDKDGNAVTDPTEVGMYTVVATGAGPFFGTNEKETFEITSKNIKTRELTVTIVKTKDQIWDGEDLSYYYTGSAIEPEVEVTYAPKGGTAQELTKDTDYEVSYEDNTDAGSASIVVTLKGNYEGSDTEYFEILPIDISGFDVELADEELEFTGSALTSDFTISGKNAAKQEVTWSSAGKSTKDMAEEGVVPSWTSNIAPGTATLIVKGTGNFTGTTAPVTMTIWGELDSTTVTAKDVFKTGKEITPDIAVNFKDSDGKDHIMPTSWYTVSNLSNDTGDWATATTYTVTVKATKEGRTYLSGKARVTGRLTDEIRGLKIDGYNATYQYTGAKIQPSTLKVVSTTGASLPTGATVTFTETGLNGGDCIRPNTTVQITAKVSYKNADGTTTSVDVENGKYSTEDNKKPATFNIVKRPIKACTFQGPSDTRYTGSALSPIFSIHTEAAQLRNGTDYTYTIRNNVRPGTATVTIRGIGNYIGTTTRTFNIYVASPTQLSVSSRSGSNATIRWKAVAHADGYRVTYISASGVRKYTTTNTSMSLTNLKTSGSTQVTVEAYVANGAGNPAWYSNPAAVYIR